MERVEKLENDMGVVVAALEKYVRGGSEVETRLGVALDRIGELEAVNAKLLVDINYIQGVLNAQHNRLDMLEHNVNHETQLNEWMVDESHQDATDFRITPKEIGEGIQNYDDQMLRYGRTKVGGGWAGAEGAGVGQAPPGRDHNQDRINQNRGRFAANSSHI
jgi:hypothetical protein